MEILKIAIQVEGGVGKLAEALDVRQNVVSNWRTRGLPKSWAQVLLLKYGQEQAKAQAAPAQPAIETVADAHAATVRCKLDAPVDRRVSPTSVGRAEFLCNQRGV